MQSARHDEPPGRPDVVSLADVYAYEPAPQQLDAAQARHVLGAQANLWTEYMDTPQRVEHAAFPRAAALAEVLWSPQAQRSWPDFLARLPEQLDRYRTLGVDFADSAFAADVSTDFTRTEAKAKLSLLRKNSDELLPCKPGQGLPLRLPGPASDGGEAVYRVDIFDPCWIYPQVDLDAASRIAVSAAALPYNFQLWKDADEVVVRKPSIPGGELQIRLDTCNGEILATIALASAVKTNGTVMLEAPMPQRQGAHNLCFVFNRATSGPMWAIDTIQLLP
jgi:hexosaminidase